MQATVHTHQHPSRNISTVAKHILKLLDLKPTDFVGHLGCGTGDIVVHMAKTGATVAGIDANPHNCEQARLNLKRHRLDRHAAVVHADIWQINVCHFKKLYVSINTPRLLALESKLLHDLTVGTQVVTPVRFPHWKPETRAGNLFLYRRY